MNVSACGCAHLAVPHGRRVASHLIVLARVAHHDAGLADCQRCVIDILADCHLLVRLLLLGPRRSSSLGGRLGGGLGDGLGDGLGGGLLARGRLRNRLRLAGWLGLGWRLGRSDHLI